MSKPCPLPQPPKFDPDVRPVPAQARNKWFVFGYSERHNGEVAYGSRAEESLQYLTEIGRTNYNPRKWGATRNPDLDLLPTLSETECYDWVQCFIWFNWDMDAFHTNFARVGIDDPRHPLYGTELPPAPGDGSITVGSRLSPEVCELRDEAIAYFNRAP